VRVGVGVDVGVGVGEGECEGKGSFQLLEVSRVAAPHNPPPADKR